MAIRYDNYIKRPNQEIEYTEENIQELLRCRDDIFYFTKNYVKIVTLDKGEILFDPYEYQLETLNLLANNRFFIGLWARQSGKALSLDTPIAKPFGKWTTMGDIKVGDVILGKDGNPTKVTFTTEVMNNHDCYEIEFDNQEKIIADKEHLWKIGSSQFRKRTENGRIGHLEKILTTEEIFNLNWQDRSFYVNYNEGIKNKKIDLPIDPYICGLWLGDGHSENGRISTNDEDYKEISKIIEQKYKISDFKSDKRNEHGGHFNVYKLMADLRESEILNNKHIPNIYFSASKYQRLELLRGLLDSDGSCCQGGSCEFYQKNYNLILQVRELLSSLGVKSKIRDKEVNGEIYYTISFTTRKFYVFNLKRKRELQKKCKDHPKNNRIYIKSIKKIDSVPVRCIQVDNKDHLFLCGKTMIPTHNSTIVSNYALWYAIFNDDKNIGIVSNKETSAKRILDNIKKMYESLPVWLKPGVTEYAKTSLTFDNGTKILISATTQDAFRGWPMNIVICDEFAFVPSNAAEEFWSSNYPTISSSTQSRIIIISTPNGMFNIFHRLWTGAVADSNSFIPQKITWENVPGRNKAWAKEQIKNLGIHGFNQEFGCQFIGSTNTVLNPETLRTLLNMDRDPRFMDLKDRLRIWEKPLDGCKYVIGCDPGKGTGEHDSGIQILRINSTKPVDMTQVAVFRNNLTDVYEFSQIIHRLSIYYNNAYILCENNGDGAAVIGQLWWHWENENLVNSGSKEASLGIRSNKNTKPKAVLLMKKLIEDGSIELQDRETIEQLGSYIEEGGKFFGKDKPDDLVDALFWACYIFEMNILDDEWNFKGNEEKDSDDAWGILSDIEDDVDDWSWLTNSSVFDH